MKNHQLYYGHENCAGLTRWGQRGDGQITVAEFLEGAIRLRGLAKSVDLAQVGPGGNVWMEIRIPSAGEM